MTTTAVAPISMNRPEAASSSGKTAVLAIFMISLLIPVHPLIGGLRMDPYRMFFILIYLPMVVRLFSGAAGRVVASDWLIVAYAFWVVLSYLVNHGMEKFAYSLSWIMETSGGYFLGRMIVRNAADYRRFVYFHVALVFCLAPFAFYELMTNHMVISEVLGQFLPATPKNLQERMGFYRVQVVFPHSILFGLYCSIAIANVYYAGTGHWFRRALTVFGVTAVTLTSLSSAPLLSILVQTGLSAYDKITKGSWKALAALAAVAYVVVDSISNRTPLTILIEKLTLDPQTGWFRIHIWNYGIQNVWKNPVFGLGENDWERPDWLTSSVDNFWLLNAMRNGIPAFLFLAFAILLHAVAIIRAPLHGEAEKQARTGYLIVLFGITFVLMTVHVWDALAVFIMFYVGAGSFFYTGKSAATADASENTVGAMETAELPGPRTTPNGTRLAQVGPAGSGYRFKVKKRD